MKANSFKVFSVVIIGWVLMLPTLSMGQEGVAEDAFTAALTNLKSGSMQERGQAIEQLAGVPEPQAIIVLQALLDGRLFKLRAEDRLVIGKELDAGYQLVDAQTAESLGMADRSATQKINVTNKLRTELRKLIGRLQLNDQDADVRLAAVNALAVSVDAESLALLRDHLPLEQDEDVQQAIGLILGLEQLNSTDKTQRLAAIDLLKGQANQHVVNRFNELVGKDAEGQRRAVTQNLV